MKRSTKSSPISFEGAPTTLRNTTMVDVRISSMLDQSSHRKSFVSISGYKYRYLTTVHCTSKQAQPTHPQRWLVNSSSFFLAALSFSSLLPMLSGSSFGLENSAQALRSSNKSSRILNMGGASKCPQMPNPQLFRNKVEIMPLMVTALLCVQLSRK